MLCAIDIGNSKTDMLLLTTDGHLLSWLRTGAISPAAIGAERTARALATLSRIAAEGSTITNTWVGAAGVDFPDQAANFHEALSREGCLGDIMVHNDIDAVLACADGMDVGFDASIAVVLGAGMNAVGVRDLSEVRFAALGEFSGDLGGGSEVGRAAVLSACRAADGRGEPSTLQALVPAYFGMATTDLLSRALADKDIHVGRLVELGETVFQQARQGDPVSRRIVESQADEVAVTIRATARRLQLSPSDCSIVLGGSILRHGRDVLEPRIRSASDPHSLHLKFLDYPPVAGAAAAVVRAAASPIRADQIAIQLAAVEPDWRPVRSLLSDAS